MNHSVIVSSSAPDRLRAGIFGVVIRFMLP